jgi:hypothetical protein
MISEVFQSLTRRGARKTREQTEEEQTEAFIAALRTSVKFPPTRSRTEKS